MGQGEEGREEQVVIVGLGLGAGLFDKGVAPPCLLGAHCQPPEDLIVGAGERQLLQSAAAKPAAFCFCRNPGRLTARNLIRLQRDAVAGDGVFDRAQRFKCPRTHSQGAVSRSL